MAARRGPLHSVPTATTAKPPIKRAATTAKKTTARKPKGPPKSIVQAAQSGTDRELLIAMRDRIAEDLDSRSTLARDLASLSKRLMELQREITAIAAREEQEGKAKNAAVPDEAFDASAF